jgi:hypothetical protein
MFEFGAGTLWGFPVGGNTAANPTPMKFGTLQDVTLDISGDVKQLYGQKQFPEAVARGKCKITGKSKFAAINGKMMNDLFFGQTLGTGMIKTALDESASVPTTPFTVTVSNAAQFKQDWGVRYTATGIPLTRVASAPVLGQYSVNTGTGVYTFAAADTGAAVLIIYIHGRGSRHSAQYHQPTHGLCADNSGFAGDGLQHQPIFRAVVFSGGVEAHLCDQAGRLHHS